MPTLTIKHPDGSEQEQELAESLTVGRADGNDLVLAEGGVSRNHARFYVEGGQVLVEDQGSANGTWVDGAKIEGATTLSAKAQVVIGDYEIKLKGNGAGSVKKPGARSSGKMPAGGGGPSKGVPRSTKMVQAVKADPAAGAALAKRTRPQAGPSSGLVLRGLTGALLNKSFSLKGTMTVGRVPGVEIQLDDDSVSRKHAEVIVQGKKVILRDLGSANGTAVNGQPLTEEIELSNGDIIQFGVVEVAFETGEAPAGSARLSRRGGPGGGAGGPGGRRSRREQREDEAIEAELSQDELSSVGMAPKTKRLMIVGGVLLTLVVIAAVAKAMQAPEGPVDGRIGPPRPPPRGQGIQCANDEDCCQQYLAACRQFSSPELQPPDWEKAEGSCRKCIEINPIDDDANQLLGKIKMEREAEEAFERGKKDRNNLRQVEALKEFAKIPKQSYYYNQALPIVRDTIEKVKSTFSKDCKEYYSGRHFKEAKEACEGYMTFACQNMTREELQPPALKKFKPPEANLGKDGWRPKDDVYLKFLTLRYHDDPGAPPWVCPPCELCIKNEKVEQPCDKARKVFETRYKENADLAEAMGDYCEGKVREATVTLQKVRENRDLASLHSVAKNMFDDMNAAEQHYKDGQSELADNRPDRAASSFCDALTLDEKLMLADKVSLPADQRKNEIDKFPSYFRHNTERDMASHSYSRGKELADRGDRRQACRIWKLGFSFWHGNPDLLRALTNVCTAEASSRMAGAATCDDLDVVLEYAVDGDGHKEEVEKKRAELACPPSPPDTTKCGAPSK